MGDVFVPPWVTKEETPMFSTAIGIGLWSMFHVLMATVVLGPVLPSMRPEETQAAMRPEAER
jgi:hypothetical protein